MNRKLRVLNCHESRIAHSFPHRPHHYDCVRADAISAENL